MNAIFDVFLGLLSGLTFICHAVKYFLCIWDIWSRYFRLCPTAEKWYFPVEFLLLFSSPKHKLCFWMNVRNILLTLRKSNILFPSLIIKKYSYLILDVAQFQGRSKSPIYAHILACRNAPLPMLSFLNMSLEELIFDDLIHYKFKYLFWGHTSPNVLFRIIEVNHSRQDAHWCKQNGVGNERKKQLLIHVMVRDAFDKNRNKVYIGES